MSYCVNCGVELAESEKVCPLCQTEVVNPKQPWTEPKTGPYPKRVENIVTKVDRQFGALLASVLLAIPVGVTLFADTIADNVVSWSLWVLGSAIVVFFFVLFPLLYKKPHPYYYLIVDTVVLAVFLAMISYNTSTEWYLPLGLPLVVFVGVCIFMSVYVFRRGALSVFSKFAIQSAITGICAVGIEIIINLYAQTNPIVNWSVYVLLTCLIFSVIMLILRRKKHLQEEIKRRLFI